MNFGRAFGYVFEDDHWIEKMVAAALITMVPILNLTLSGYVVMVIRNVANDSSYPLPEWKGNLGDFFLKGLYVLVAKMIYGLIPLGVILSTIAVAYGENGDFGLTQGSFLVLAVGILLLILASLISTIARIRFSTGTLTFNELFDIKGHLDYLIEYLGELLMAWLYIVVFTIMVIALFPCSIFMRGRIPFWGAVVGCVFSIVVIMLSALFSAHIYGQLAAETGLAAPQVTES
ncbi:MAG: DUF4013 domain-containing protein [Anaerolineae bacterium]|nr:DUF4013 domain-containing protein [Anaerolineae bacterium]